MARAAIVTGAAGGIGRATCERLSRAGWQVLAVDQDAEKLGWTKDAGIAASVADIASEADNIAMVAEAEDRFGGLDAMILNAAVTGGGAIDALAFEDFRRVIEVNLFGPVHGIRAALPALRRRGGGAIAITASTMGIAGESENSAYCASKHALVGLVHSLSRELGWQGIRINALCPGPTRTGMTSLLEDAAPEHFEALRRAVPLQRWAEADEMASCLEFLVSPAASYVNGHVMVADGGAVVGTGLAPPASGAAPAMPDH